jgi:adenosylmethionine-8-amino-7-oxononanoate aminotransferase
METSHSFSSDWVAADRANVWHPYTQMLTAPPAVPIVRAEGVYLVAADGRRILDGISSWWVNLHGHNHPRLNRALSEQASKLAQVIFAGFTHEPAARLAAELSRRSPGRLQHVFFSDDGSTAVEVALKMAYQHWKNRGEPHRRLFVALDNAYHGDTFGAMAAGGVALFHESFKDLLFQVRRARSPSPFRSESRSLEEILATEGERVAAVLIEPMLQGAGGMIVWPVEFLRQVRDLTARHHLPLIADEVLTGFGRTGKLFACEHGPVAPDILCLSKALTGGYLPLGATLASDEIYESYLSEDRGRTFFHGHSYTGNALACAVALESLSILDDEKCLERVARMEALFRERLSRLRELPAVAGTRGLGGVGVVELASREGGYLDHLGPRLQGEFLKRGVLLRPLGNVLYFMPPYAITDDEVSWVFDQIEEVIK